jgi:NAD(P)-dependent dehydrogenase (short-subunit alcohol dehydrogenase family)
VGGEGAEAEATVGRAPGPRRERTLWCHPDGHLARRSPTGRSGLEVRSTMPERKIRRDARAATGQGAGRIAVVTGASSGIGEATVHRLAHEGWTVVAAARRADRLEGLARRAADECAPGRVVPATLDVRDTSSVDALAARVREEHGACHLLVCNAGIGGGSLAGRDDLMTALDVIDVNLAGTLRCCASFVDLLTESAPSQVINVASVAGKLGLGPAAYVASKFGMVGLSEALAAAWRSRDIVVTQLNPGFVHTEGFPQTWADGTPVARLVVGPEVVARAVSRAARRRSEEVTSPHWYRGLVVLRHVATPVWRGIGRLAEGPRRRSEALRAQRAAERT